MTDTVNHPKHYNAHPSGVECIEITQHMNFCLGNAVKYIWRADLKGDAITDLEKARWYIEQEIARRHQALKPPYATGGMVKSAGPMRKPRATTLMMPKQAKTEAQS